MPIQALTATDLIYGALRDLGCLRAGQGPAPDQLADSLVALNELIDGWLLNGLMVYAFRPDIYTLVAGQQVYTIGPAAADFTAPRPTEIQDANIILNTVTPVVRRPMAFINVDQWAALRLRDIPFAIPTSLYYDKGFDVTNGWGTLNLWPGPLSEYQLELFTWQQLQYFPDLVSTVKLPPGYARALRKNLAVEIAPMQALYFKGTMLVSQPMLQQVMAQAIASKAEIESYNAKDAQLVCDPAFMNARGYGWNWMTGGT